MERLAAAYVGALRELIEHGRRRVAALLPGLKEAEDVYPLTPLQGGMLFHSLMAPESGVYVNQLTCALAADLDPGLFRQAWERIVERHTVLRTAFLWDGLDEPLQIVHRRVSLPWRELAGEDRFEELRLAEQRAPMPLDRAPLTRFALVRRDGGFGFVWTFHHLLLDGWSLPLLMRELATVYAALREGREPILPPARPFADYVAWLRRRDPAREEAFWRSELAGFTAPNSLGVVAPAREEGASGYAEHHLQLSREVTAELQSLAARHKLTLQTVTLGAWALLAGRYSGQEDVVFGNTVSGRPADLPGVEAMAGMFINTLPARARVDDAQPLAPWLRKLQERQLAWREHEHSPLALVQRWSAVPAGSPLFETLYVFENYPSADVADGGLGIGDLRSHESTNYPVTLLLTAADHVGLRLMTDRARVDEDEAPRLLGHLAAFLAGMAEGLERLAGEVGMLTAAETLQLRAWNGTDVSYDLDRPLHAWIEDQVRRTPEAVALAFEGEELTYAELDRRSNRLARLLQDRGCGPESRVGVLLERSNELLIALHGILKAGAAYVPLDPEHPADRLAFQDDDARLRLIVT
ncbi:MAG TPA: condensation domain-containing protein, partial [Thermoanaerobaculia bacterium]|nr:condensation domain-containing protein [Thermoanaerobaculia bacterium]